MDSSRGMLERARQRLPSVRFSLADIANYCCDQPQDLVLANASLHWLGEHTTLLPRLLEQLAPGGVLGIQMPDNRAEPSHQLMRDIAAMEPFSSALGEAPVAQTALLEHAQYSDCLAPLCTALSLWETRYLHVLEGHQAIVDWFASTGLKPFIDRLPSALQKPYLDKYREELTAAYPTRVDGRVLLEMPRLFIVAQR
ncbi:MAG: trans-aconitate 2-methyltransferase [Halieaceae bacterium]